MTPRALVADDERAMRFLLEKHLQRRGWEVISAADGTEAFDRLAEEQFDAVVLDQRMPGMTGLEVLRTTSRTAPTFIFSAYLDPALAREIDDLGSRSINKLDIDELLEALDVIAEELRAS